MGATRRALGRERSYASPAQVTRLIRALRAQGVNPSSLKFGVDGSVHLSANPTGINEPLSAFEQWDAAGKL